MANRPIRLLPNEPQTVKLLDPYADSCERYDAERAVGEYRTTDGRILALPRPAVLLLNGLDLQPGEMVTVCRYTKERGRVQEEWTVSLSPSTEKTRAQREQETQDAPAVPSDEELLLEASLKRQKARNAQKPGNVAPIRKPSRRAVDPEMQPRLFDRNQDAYFWNGTGTDGPGSMPDFADRARFPLPANLPRKTAYPDMLRHIVRTVRRVLKEEQLQLGDEPTERLIVTIFIDAAKRCGIEYDFRDGEK